MKKDRRGNRATTANGRDMRMRLLRNITDASKYHYHTEQTINTLRATANGKTPFEIRKPEVLKRFSEQLGIDISGSVNDIALRLCTFVEADFKRIIDDPSVIVQHLAPAESKEQWKKLDIFPGGIYAEMMRATFSCLSNVDDSPVSLAMKSMRMTVAIVYQSQIVNEHCRDILFGIARRSGVSSSKGTIRSLRTMASGWSSKRPTFTFRNVHRRTVSWDLPDGLNPNLPLRHRPGADQSI